MGNDVSTEASGKITRTSSLKDVSTTSPSSGENKKVSGHSAKPVKRSSTFSGVPRPQIVRRVKKKTKQNSSCDEHREAIVHLGLDEDARVDALLRGESTDLRGGSSVVKQQRAGSNDENLFIPTKRSTSTTSLSATKRSTSSSSLKHSPSLSHKSLQLASSADQTSTSSRPTSTSTPTTSEMGASPSSSREILSSSHRTSSSSIDDDGSRTSTQEKPHTEESGDNTSSKNKNNKNSKNKKNNENRNTASDEEYKVSKSKITRTKSNEKGASKNKVTRSKSLGAQPNLGAVAEEEVAPQSKSLERITDKNTTDINKLRQEHVQRAAHYSAMLKHAKQHENRVHSYDLSPYAQEILAAVPTAARTTTTTTRPPRRILRQNDFFDKWISEQSARIDDLSQAVRGNELKMNQLRTSFRGRQGCGSAVAKLPARPHTDTMPRRQLSNNNNNKYLSSDTEDELDNNININSNNNNNNNNNNNKKRSCSADYQDIYKPTHSEDPLVKKQLTDTLEMLSSYFEQSKNQDDDEQILASGRSSAHSMVSGRSSSHSMVSGRSSAQSSAAYHTGDSNLFLSETDIVGEQNSSSVGDEESVESLI